jgi:hypothetical protein
LSSSASTFGIGSVAGVLQFYDSTNAAERMRIDSSGNLLVGKTSTAIGTAGATLWSDGLTDHTRSGEVLRINRLSTDGDIVTFRKDGTTVGSIGVLSSRLAIGTGDTGLFFNDQTDEIQPWNMTSNTWRDDAIDLGTSTRRFKDLYLSGGVYLGGTGAANKLDDYEEGTFTATATPETSGTITLQSGVDTLAYTKIGSLCTIQGLINVTSVSSPVGDAIAIATLPFIAADLAEFAGRSVASVAFRDNSTSSWSNEVAWVGEGGTSFNIYKDASTVASNDQFYITLTYRTT